jgi:hypothetical protein
MIGQHALDIERFQGDGAVTVDQSPADLMMEIPPLIGHPFMLDCHPMSGFVPIVFTKRGATLDQRFVASVRFVPLIGQFGWQT